MTAADEILMHISNPMQNGKRLNGHGGLLPPADALDKLNLRNPEIVNQNSKLTLSFVL
jgi:hypothetical protein